MAINSVISGISTSTALNSQIGVQSALNWFDVNAEIFEIKYILPLNMSSNTNITMDVCAPENDNFQRILSIGFDPTPNSTYTDGSGQAHVRFELTTRNPEFLNITATYSVLVIFSSLTGVFSQAQNLENVPRAILENYTKPAPYIESDNLAIVGNATSLTANDVDIESKIDSLFNFVANESLFTYDSSVQNITRNADDHVRGGLWALQNRRGVCFDFACLLVALLRAVNIPSRISEGIILDGRSGFLVHDWVEVYLAGIGWVPYDPTWNEAECNLHMKLLNPIYDSYMRWNYTLQSGFMYNFPEDSPYSINDQINIINQTSPKILDSIAFRGSYATITRTMVFQNETVSSVTNISNSDEMVENSYGALDVRLTNDIVGTKIIDYDAYFNQYSPQSLQVSIAAPWNLVFSGSFLPSLGNINLMNRSVPLQFVFVEPLLWIGVLMIVLVAIAILVLFVIKRRLSHRSTKTNTGVAFPGTKMCPVPYQVCRISSRPRNAKYRELALKPLEVI